MMYVGVDPGLSGALAFLDDGTQVLTLHDMPVRWVTKKSGKKRRVIDKCALGKIVREQVAGRAARVFVEQVGAMPGQGVTSMFSFGRATGAIDGVFGAFDIDPIEVPPRVWQATANIPPKGCKTHHRLIAQMTWPNNAKEFARNKDDGRADAALILYHGLRQEH